jgi:hypothetical protein
MIESKIKIIKREYSKMSKIPKPKPAENSSIKMEDLLKNANGSSIEDLLVKYILIYFNINII